MTPRFTILSFFSMFSLKISLSLFLEIPAYAAAHQGLSVDKIDIIHTSMNLIE